MAHMQPRSACFENVKTLARSPLYGCSQDPAAMSHVTAKYGLSFSLISSMVSHEQCLLHVLLSPDIPCDVLVSTPLYRLIVITSIYADNSKT